MLALLAAASLWFGHSAEHRPLTATRVGEGPVKVLVVGSIHGNETAGRAVLRRLWRSHPAPGVELWLVDSINPDGVRRGTRHNARGVDLNRNLLDLIADAGLTAEEIHEFGRLRRKHIRRYRTRTTLG